MALTCGTLALVAQGIHLQALTIIEAWRGVTWDILVLTVLPCIARMAHTPAQRTTPFYQSKLFCMCVWNKTENVWDSHSSIAEDSSLQGPGLALRYFRHTGNYLPNRTQHPVDLNPSQSLPQLKSTVFNLLYPTDQLQKNTTNFSTLYIWGPCDACPLEQQRLWRQYRHHCSELKMALLRKAYMYTRVYIYILLCSGYVPSYSLVEGNGLEKSAASIFRAEFKKQANVRKRRTTRLYGVTWNFTHTCWFARNLGSGCAGGSRKVTCLWPLTDVLQWEIHCAEVQFILLCSVVLHLATAVQKCDFRLVTNLTPTSGDHWTMTCARQDKFLTGRTCFVRKGWRQMRDPSHAVEGSTYTSKLLTCTIRACWNSCRADRGPPCTPQCPLHTRGPQTPQHKCTCTYPPATRTLRHFDTAWRRSDPAARSAVRCSRARRYTSSCLDSSVCMYHRWDTGPSHTSWPPESHTARLSSRWGRCTRRWGWT